MQVMTPSTTSRLPTMDFAISARSVSMRLRKRVTCSRTASVSVMSLASLVFAGANELEVTLHVEAIAARDVVLRERLLRDLVVLRVDLLVAARGEAPLCGAQDYLAARA